MGANYSSNSSRSMNSISNISFLGLTITTGIIYPFLFALFFTPFSTFILFCLHWFFLPHLQHLFPFVCIGFTQLSTGFFFLYHGVSVGFTSNISIIYSRNAIPATLGAKEGSN